MNKSLLLMNKSLLSMNKSLFRMNKSFLPMNISLFSRESILPPHEHIPSPPHLEPLFSCDIRIKTEKLWIKKNKVDFKEQTNFSDIKQ